MPWKETTTMEQKIEFICEWRTRNHSITELYRNFEISPPTTYKLMSRFKIKPMKVYENTLEHLQIILILHLKI